MGTLSYMSPEQLRDTRSVDLRTDLWAVGVIVYELLSGVLPYRSDTLGNMLLEVMSQPPRAIIGLAPPLEAFLQRALARDPAARFPSAAAMSAALDALPMTSG